MHNLATAQKEISQGYDSMLTNVGTGSITLTVGGEATVINLELYGLFNIPHVNQVYIMFRADLEQPRYSAGPESLDVKLVTENEIPWDELAFPVIRRTLDLFLEDRRRGVFGNHMFDIAPLKK